MEGKKKQKKPDNGNRRKNDRKWRFAACGMS